MDVFQPIENVRVQFGQPISKFQAIQHQLSVMSEHAFAARMAAQLGLCATGQVPDRLRVAMAKARTAVELTAPTQVFADLARQNSGAALGLLSKRSVQRHAARIWREAA